MIWITFCRRNVHFFLSVFPSWQQGNVVKHCGMSVVQILRRWGSMVSSSLHKPSAADMGVARGVTEHSKWTSQTLRGASSGLPLMPSDLASGTERKCCRTRRGYRRSRHRSACQPADCGRKGRVRGDRKESPRNVILRTKQVRTEIKKKGEKEHTLRLTQGVFSCWVHEYSSLPSFRQTSLLSFSHQKAIPLSTHRIPSLSVQWSRRPSIPPSWATECKANRPRSEWGSCQSLAAKHVWQGTNSTDRGETPTKPSQRSKESLGN